MKKFTKNLIVLLGIGIISICSVFAQTEVTVEGGLNTLYNAVVDNPGATLILLRGESYVIDKTIEITVPTIIKGETTPEATAPAVVSFYGDPGTASNKVLFSIGANCTLQDFGMSGFTADLQQIKGLFTRSAGGIDVTLDGIVGQSANRILSGAAQNDGKLTVKNCKFFNFVNEGWDNYGGFGFMAGGSNDTFKSTNNTFFMCGRILDNGFMTNGSLSHNEHNSYVNIWGETYYPEEVESFVAKNNLYYNTGMRGFVGPRYDSLGWDADYKDGDYNDFSGGDSLQGDICIYPTQAEKDGGGKTRLVNVSNNVSFTSANILAAQKAMTATMMPLLNKTMRNWFATYSHWILKDNKTMETGDGIDPQFKQAIPDEAYNFVYKQIIQRRKATLQETGFPFAIGWWPNAATKADFIWPLPFNLRPTNPTLTFAGDDGYAIGDLNWYGPEVRMAWENKLANPMLGIAKHESDKMNVSAYPNPVRSTSKISYTVPANGKVKLSVFNTVGVEVSTLVNATQTAGLHEVNFDASNLASGVYLCKIQVGSKSVVQKITVLK